MPESDVHRRGGWVHRLLEGVYTARQSLRFRLTLGVSVALGIILIAFVILHYLGHRARTWREAEANVAGIGLIIEGSLEHAMLTRDLAELQQIIDNVARRRNIRSVLLLNTDGEIRFAPEGKGVGSRLDPRRPDCQACHQAGAAARGRSIVYTTPEGERVLRNCNPIANQPACHACHDASKPLTGALLTDFSLAETNAHLAAELRINLLAGLGVVVVGAVTVNLLLDRLMLRRLDRMMLAIRRFGAGDRSQRVPAHNGDEVGRLAATFNRMADGLQAREQEAARLYGELAQKEATLAQLLHRVIAVQEEERKRIARELHDDFAQTLTALTLALDAALCALPEADAALRQQLTLIQSLTATTLSQTDRWIQDLRPLLLDDLGLVPAVRRFAEMRLEPCGVDVQFDSGGLKGRLPAQLETTLFRVIQEAVNNVAKHARARHVHIGLECAAGQIVATVRDDGIGFDPRASAATGDGLRGIGLLGMRERVLLVGGQLSVDSEPGRGTLIRVEVPWPT